MDAFVWSDLKVPIERAWLEIASPRGSFADGPCEVGATFEATLNDVAPLETVVDEAVKAWIDNGELPPLPPAANRYLEIRLVCALGFVRCLADLPDPSLPLGWTAQKALCWLLWEVHADTVQVALDTMRSDLLGTGE